MTTSWFRYRLSRSREQRSLIVVIRRLRRYIHTVLYSPRDTIWPSTSACIDPARFFENRYTRCINSSLASETCFARESSDALISWSTGELSTHCASSNLSNARSRPSLADPFRDLFRITRSRRAGSLHTFIPGRISPGRCSRDESADAASSVTWNKWVYLCIA